jgi:cytosine/adenosine deaminase-related metal-dependent hydrolase
MDPVLGDLVHGDVAVSGGEIVAVGQALEVPAGCEVVEAEGGLVMPGLVDTHTHLWNGVWRSFAGSGGPQTSYGALGTGMGPLFSPEDSYQAVLAASLEMVASGVTTVHNWAHNILSPEHADAEIRALRDAGVRARFSYGYHWRLPQDEPMDLEDVVRVRDQWSSGTVTVGMALRNDTTQGTAAVTFPSLSVAPSLLRHEMDVMRAHNIPLTMHIRNPGPAQYFIDAGYIGQDNLIVHGYHWDQAQDWKLLAGAGANISLSPYSCLVGMKKLMPLTHMLEHGIPTGLSFDHMNRSGNADMFRMMQLLVVNEALAGRQLPWRTAVEIATTGGAEVLGLGAVTGSLTPGKRADLIVLDPHALSIAPMHDSYMTIANSAGPGVVDTVIVDGKILKRAGRLTQWDPSEVTTAVNTTFTSLAQRYADHDS